MAITEYSDMAPGKLLYGQRESQHEALERPVSILRSHLAVRMTRVISGEVTCCCLLSQAYGPVASQPTSTTFVHLVINQEGTHASYSTEI